MTKAPTVRRRPTLLTTPTSPPSHLHLGQNWDFFTAFCCLSVLHQPNNGWYPFLFFALSHLDSPIVPSVYSSSFYLLGLRNQSCFVFPHFPRRILIIRPFIMATKPLLQCISNTNFPTSLTAWPCGSKGAQSPIAYANLLYLSYMRLALAVAVCLWLPFHRVCVRVCCAHA